MTGLFGFVSSHSLRLWGVEGAGLLVERCAEVGYGGELD